MTHFSENRNAQDAIQRLQGARVIDAAGREATVVATETTGVDLQAWVAFDDGARVLLPAGLLAAQADGGYRLPFAVAGERMQMRFPVMAETLQVDKRTVDTGRGVRVVKTVSEQPQQVEQTLLHDELTVERVAIGQMIAGAEPPHTRYEGDTLVVPVLEEVLVVQKQLRLKEEVRITRRHCPVLAAQSVSLRSEQVTVERFDER